MPVFSIFIDYTCHLEVLVKRHVVGAQGGMKERCHGVQQYNTLELWLTL